MLAILKSFLAGCIGRGRTQEETQPLPGRYVGRIPESGPSGGEISVVGADYADGVLEVTGRMSPDSLYPIQETLSALESPLFQDHEEYPEVETLVRKVVSCSGAHLAIEETRREWIIEFRNGEYNLGQIEERRNETFEGVDELRMPDRLTGENAVGADDLTCEDWQEANPEVLGTNGS